MASRRSLFIALLALFFTSPLFADRYLAEGKVGYFRPFSQDLRGIYSDGWVNYQVEISYSPFSSCNPNWWNNFFAWGGFGYSYDSGTTRTGIVDDETSIQFYTATLGIKYLQPLPCSTYFYGGGGVRYLFLCIDNQDDSVDRRERAAGLGGVVTMGFLVQAWRCIYFDFFSEITLKYFKESNFSVQNDEVAEGLDVGGATVGIGVGMRF